MKFKEKEFKINRQKLVLRSPNVSEAKMMLEYFIKINSETKFLAQDPEDIKITLKKEKEILKTYSDSKTDVMIAGFLNGKLVGTCSVNVSSNPRLKHIGTLGIGLFKKYNSKGIGTIMFNELINYSKSIGLEILELTVNANNTKAQGLYKKFGFIECGRLSNHEKFKDGSYADILLMQRSLKMNVKLVKLTKDYKDQLFEMLDEWVPYNKTHEGNKYGNRSPYAIFKNDYHDFDYYLEHLELKEPKDGLVPDSTFFLLDLDRNIFLGACNIRHYLNEGLLATGGHIGDGIRPSERRKGYATKMIELALKECKKLGINEVLMTCNKINIGSAKSITNNGGVLENEVMEDGMVLQRYWIKL